MFLSRCLSGVLGGKERRKEDPNGVGKVGGHSPSVHTQHPPNAKTHRAPRSLRKVLQTPVPSQGAQLKEPGEQVPCPAPGSSQGLKGAKKLLQARRQACHPGQKMQPAAP